jgi:hypothetical protein
MNGFGLQKINALHGYSAYLFVPEPRGKTMARKLFSY